MMSSPDNFSLEKCDSENCTLTPARWFWLNNGLNPGTKYFIRNYEYRSFCKKHLEGVEEYISSSNEERLLYEVSKEEIIMRLALS